MKSENIGFKNELSFVCALLTGVAESSQVYPRVTAEMLTSRELALIYKGIIELFNKGKAMDYTLVEHEMRALDNELYAEMNGLNYVADGLLSVVDDVHVTTYADIIVDEYQRNCLRLLAMEISGKCGSRDIPVEQLLQMATTKLEEIAGMGVNSASTRQISEIGQEVVTHHTRLLENGGTPDFTRGTLEGDIAPGKITFYRLQSTADTKLTSYIAQGEILPVATRSFGGIAIFGIHEMGRFYRHVLVQKRYPHHGAVAFGHYGKILFEVLKFLGIQDIAYNQPKSLPYPTENPFA